VPGTGLGLIGLHERVRLAGGTLTDWSQRRRLRGPRTPPDRSPHRAYPGSRRSVRPPYEGNCMIKVLLVDDEASSGPVIGLILGNAHDVEIVAEGR